MREMNERTCAGSSFGLDLSRFLKRDLCEHRSDQFVDQYSKEGNIENDRSDIAIGQNRIKFLGFVRHSECHSCLWQKRDAKIFYNVFVTAYRLGAEQGSAVFSCRTGKNVDNADQENDDIIGKDRKIQLGAADDEEQHQQGGGPTVDTVHQLLGKVADVAEDGSEHHTDEQRRKRDMYATDGEAQHRKCNRQKDESDRHRKTLGSGMEESFKEAKEEAHHKSESKRESDLKNGIDDERDEVDVAEHQCLCYAKGDSKENESHSIVKRDDGEKQIGQRALRLVLTDYHQRRGGRGSRSDGTEHDGGGQGKLVGHCKMDSDKHGVHQDRGDNGLENSDDRCLLSRLFQLSETKFVTDGEGNKAECHVGKERKGFCVNIGLGKANALHAESAEHVRSDKNTCHEICRNGGKLHELRKSGEQKSCQHRDGQA